MSYSKWIQEGNMAAIKEAAAKIMDKKCQEALGVKISEEKVNIGRRLASQSMSCCKDCSE